MTLNTNIIQKKKTKLHFQRFEFKYQMPENIAYHIMPELSNYMYWDPYVIDQSKNAYEVHSIYFDSPSFKNYYEKIDGMLARKKIRIRSYSRDINDHDNVFIEIKRKYNAVIIKDRIKMNFKDAKLLIEGKLKKDKLEEKYHNLYNEFMVEKFFFSMRPNVLVSYKRKPLISKYGENNLRVTFDYDIAAGFCHKIDFFKKTQPISPGILVMEIKFNATLPYWLQEIIQKYKLEAWPYSKYSNGVEAAYNYIFEIT